jgi:hypothetical protein
MSGKSAAPSKARAICKTHQALLGDRHHRLGGEATVDFLPCGGIDTVTCALDQED